jgi:thioredoxin 1
MNGKIRITKLDVDENQELAMNYGIRSIPSLLLFKGAKRLEDQWGPLPKRAICRKNLICYLK